MQSSQRDEVVLSTEEGQLLGAALKELESLGFLRFKQNLRLLKKTNGNLEAVRDYLVAKKKMRDAKMALKRDSKKGRKECPCRRRKEGGVSSAEGKTNDKKAEKKELKALFKAGHKEWKKSRKEWKNHRHHDDDSTSGVKREEGNTYAAVDAAKVEERTLPSLSVWPQQVTRLYLDGNNMLYVAAPLREMTIHRRMASAELALSSVAFQFTKLLPAAVKTTVVFDAASQPVLQSHRADSFQIVSARPAFATSDDALVQWAKENAAQESRVISMVVTSDRGLQKRLAEVSGVVLVKPKVWMEYAATMLEKQKKSNDNNNGVETQKPVKLDDWMALWIQKMEEESLAGQLQTSLTVSNAN